MTVQEIKQKVHRNGDTKKYRKILAELNDVPVSVINAVLDDTLMPKGVLHFRRQGSKSAKDKVQRKRIVFGERSFKTAAKRLKDIEIYVLKRMQ